MEGMEGIVGIEGCEDIDIEEEKGGSWLSYDCGLTTSLVAGVFAPWRTMELSEVGEKRVLDDIH